MKKILAKIEAIIDKIPIHIRDIIQKGFFAMVALVALVAILTGIKKGIENATPGGVQLFGKNADLFYIQKIREENKKKSRLVEDVDIYKELFESRDERIHPTFRKLGRDTDDRLIGENEEFIKKTDPLKKKEGEFLFDDNKSDEKVLPDNIEPGKKKVSEETPLMDDSKSEKSKPTDEDFNKSHDHQKSKIREDKKTTSGIQLID